MEQDQLVHIVDAWGRKGLTSTPLRIMVIERVWRTSNFLEQEEQGTVSALLGTLLADQPGWLTRA